VGNTDLSEDVMKALNEEKAENKDILALPLVDSYQTLTNKMLTSLVQLNRNVHFKYLLKVKPINNLFLPAAGPKLILICLFVFSESTCSGVSKISFLQALLG
jgi:hypothetical protein